MTRTCEYLLTVAAAALVMTAPCARAQEAVPAHLPRDGLVGLWLTDGSARDSAGKSHGTIGRGVTFAADRHGKANGALVFNGKSGFVSIPDSPQLDTDNAFTVSAWVKPAGFNHNPGGRYSMILSKWCSSGVAGDYILGLHTSGVPFLNILDRNPTTVMDTVTAKSVVPIRAWTHVAATFDRGQLAIYVNGRLEANKVSKLKHTDRGEYAQDDLVIGGYWRDGFYNFHGAIDEVGVWNRVLSATEIASVTGRIPLPRVTRLALLDRVETNKGNLLLGTLLNKRYSIECVLGKIDLPAEKVVGLVAPMRPEGTAEPKDPHVQLILTDGQVIAGRLLAQAITLKMGLDSMLRIPIRSLRQCSYRISRDKPAGITAAGAMMILRSGDHLRIANTDLKLPFKADWGTINLPIECLQRIGPPKAGGTHRLMYLANGSMLTGTLAAKKLTLKSTFGRELTVETKDVRWLTGTATGVKARDGAAVVMSNGDSLLGRLADKTLTVRTKFGETKMDVAGIAEVQFDPGKPLPATVRIWDATIVKGTLAEKSIALRIAGGGPVVNIPTARIARITRAAPVPPPAICKKVEQLIIRLAAESYADREAATKELLKMGKNIIPLLKKHLNSPDAEVRQRIASILEQLGSSR